MKTIISVILSALLFTGLSTNSEVFAQAKSIAYSASAFSEAQAAGKTIIVDVYADWCPTCQAQKPILNELKAEPGLAAALFVSVDFDQEKDFLRAHRIPRQSTILVFRGKDEVTRSVAETDRGRLRAAVLSAARGS